MPLTFILSKSEDLELKKIARFSDNWRIRERASTLLSLADGISCSKAAEIMGLSRTTVESTRREWFKSKFDSLPDLPRTGAPSKIKPEEVVKILTLVDDNPLSATDVLKAHIENDGAVVHVETIRALLRKNGRVWKMTRHSLKKKK